MASQVSVVAFLLSVCAFSLDAAAQTASPNPITQTLRGAWTEAKTNIRKSADVMPEAKYGFKPVETVRSFGAILAHVAGASYEFCAAARGDIMPRTRRRVGGMLAGSDVGKVRKSSPKA